MSDIPIHNETEYAFTPDILDQIRRDAIEYFGDSIRAIRVQYGIERHTFNVRTREMRYAFSPRDFDLIDTTVLFPGVHFNRDAPSIDDEDTDEKLDDDEEEEPPRFQALEDEFDDLNEEDKKLPYNPDYD
ncbi:hypothetical protein NKDENANG_02147 [Candidatus Entotheonellaceae bacterium PAL068K]